MLLPSVDPTDFVNKHLRAAAAQADERGEKVAAWHGTDSFTGEDVEVYINLTTKIAGLALGRTMWAGQLSEKGNLLVIHFQHASKGIVELDIHSEVLSMNYHRTGIEVFNDGRNAHLRLYDRLSGQDILDLHGDQMTSLIHDGALDPKDYQGSAFKYAQQMALV